MGRAGMGSAASPGGKAGTAIAPGNRLSAGAPSADTKAQ
jgi:hypothetical protein